jgi:hypothetical protein
MGGSGSGNWYRWKRKKDTVENSLVVGMKDLPKRLYVGAAGTLTWTWGSGTQSSIGYHVTGAADLPIMNLHYRRNDTEDVKIPVRLQATPTHFGGQRWWFICPLIVRGMACNRRAGKLYLSPGAKYFGCRKCHDLTYRSCQEAHQAERLFGRLGLSVDDAKMWERMNRTLSRVRTLT